LQFGGLGLEFELLACAGDGESLVVEQLFDVEREFDFASAIHALAGAALGGLELREFRFPKTENIGRQFA